MAEVSKPDIVDLNQDSQSTLQDAEPVGKSFLRNVREKWSKVPQGWAQKRTNSADNDSSPSERDGTSSSHEDSTPVGEKVE